jgi:hypothetical protein
MTQHPLSPRADDRFAALVRRYAFAASRAVVRTAGLAFNLVCLPVVLVAILATRLIGESPGTAARSEASDLLDRTVR